MTQLQPPLEPKFTFDTLVDAVANFEASFGYEPKRFVIARRNYDELLESLPLGATLYAAEHGLPLLVGVELEVRD